MGVRVPHPKPPTHLPPHPIPLGHPSEYPFLDSPEALEQDVISQKCGIGRPLTLEVF